MKHKLEELEQQLVDHKKKIVREKHNCCCLLDLNYSSSLLSSKIADIPYKLKYETIIAPIFEYCFGTSDQDIVWEEFNDHYINDDDDDDIISSSLINLRIDWIRDETFIYSQLFKLVLKKLDVIARTFGLWSNRKFILNSYYTVPYALFYSSKQLKNDRELVLELVRESGWNFEYASNELRNDKEIATLAVKSGDIAFGYASNQLKDDKEFVMLALESFSCAYTYASDRLQNDRDVVFKAVSHGCPLDSIIEKFKNDRELFLISKIPENLQSACNEFRNDKEIILKAVPQACYAFEFASDALKRDRKFVQEIVMINYKCLRFAPKEFQDDKEIVELAFKSSPDTIYYISDRLRKDTEFISNMIGKRGFTHLPIEFSNDREIVLESIKLNSENLEKASNELQNDREFILQAIKLSGMALKYAKEEFKSDREIVMTAVTQNGDALVYIPDNFFKDYEIIIKATQTATFYMPSFYNKLSENMKSDKEFLKKCGVLLSSCPRKYQLDREIILEILKTHPDLVLLKAKELIASDRVLAMKIVKRNGLLLQKLPFKFRNDREIVSFAIQQNKKAFKFASNELQQTLNMI